MARQRKETSGRNASRSGDRKSSERDGTPDITEKEIEDIEELSSPRAPVIYEIVRRLGEEEMHRPGTSLWWSGLAAGLSIGFSLLAQALLQMHLPDESWRPLVVNFGYCIGFLMAVLSRQQLFTENTITALLPVMASPNVGKVAKLARMWGIVLMANLAGTFFAALFWTYAPTITPELRAAMLEISQHILHHSWAEMFFKSISAGFLIAAMVWLMPSAEGAQFHIVVLMTYLVSLGEFMHIVAGSLEGFMLVFDGSLGPGAMLTQFVIPVLLGNVVGGTALFGLIAYAQVMNEI